MKEASTKMDLMPKYMVGNTQLEHKEWIQKQGMTAMSSKRLAGRDSSCLRKPLIKKGT